MRAWIINILALLAIAAFFCIPMPAAGQNAVPTAYATPKPFVCANATGCTIVVEANAIPRVISVPMVAGQVVTFGYAPDGNNCVGMTPIATLPYAGSPKVAIMFSHAGMTLYSGVTQQVAWSSSLPAYTDLCIKTTRPTTGSEQ